MVLRGTYLFLKTLESVSDERLIRALAVLRAIVWIGGFLGIVVIWDTLPARSPITEVRLTRVESSSVGMVFLYTYTVKKTGEFSMEYLLTKDDENIAIRDSQTLGRSFVAGTTETHAHDFGTLKPGNWCLESKIVWSNGLSLRKHHSDILKKCFQV